MRLIRNVRIKFNGFFGPLPQPEKWVFIVGCYNSGTTLLHKLLATHPDVGSMPDEGQFYTDQFVIPKEVGLARLWAIEPERFYLDENSREIPNIDKLKRQWGVEFNDSQAPVLIEKSPPNAARTRWLQQYFENAHFIGIIRNGYAVAEGIRRKAGHPLDIAARQWVNSNRIMLRDFEYLQHKLLVNYETLTASPNEMYQKILDFLKLEPQSEVVSNKLWSIHRQLGPIRDMNHRSLTILSKREREVIGGEAGDMLRHLGYAS